MKKTAGFSLIELLFVIAVLGILSTAGILFYQQYMQNQKIEKTVSQIEQWMQAGAAYYVRNKKWPDNAAALITEGYMPVGSDNSNPWCSSGCYTIQARVQGSLLEVAAIMPSANDAVRQAIKSRLAYTDENAPAGRVVALVNVPWDKSRNMQGSILVKMLPYRLLGSSFIEGTQDKNEVWGFVTGGRGLFVGRAPKCSQLYGADYTDQNLELYTSVTAYRADQKGQAQQPAFSLLSVRAENDGGEIRVKAEVRPQIYVRGELPFDWLIAQLSNDVKNAIEIRGYVYVFCKRTVVPTTTTDFRF